MIRLKDQMDFPVVLDHPAQRIVSLVPSQTELLYDLGLDDETVSITKFCIHPDKWFRSKIRVGGTKNVAIDKVKSLHPDLIIANKEENSKPDIEKLKQLCPVYISDIITVKDALNMMKDVGKLCGREQQTVDIIDQIEEDRADFPTYSGTVLYLIWKNPFMACGSDNFINSMIHELGFTNVVTAPRYVEVSAEEIQQLNPDYIFLSTEPFPFKEEDKDEWEKLSRAKVKIVDGEMFSWYGSRMLKMKEYFRHFLDGSKSPEK
ncbi:MAG: helical backbone metal receptor [Crocinitomicaceae bacterium]